MGKRRNIFWLSDSVLPIERSRARLLFNKGYDVQFFSTIEALIHELHSRRAGIVIASDSGGVGITTRNLYTLATISEIQGARLILTTTAADPGLAELAAASSFRDVIPLNIEDKLWLQRFIFATGSRPIQHVQPSGQVTLNNISAVSFPARITWISNNQIRIESRVQAPAGVSISLTGPFADAIGLPAITLNVIKTQRDHLIYRFSDALIANWNVPDATKPRVLETLNKLEMDSPGPRCRIFIAARDAALRRSLLDRFQDPQFEVGTALQKQSIALEPKFFSPNLVLIEENLCFGAEGELFDQMMANIGPRTAVLVVGEKVKIGEIKKRHPRKKIIAVTAGVSDAIIQRYLPRRERRDPNASPGASYVTADSPFSFANLTLSARLQRIHPLAGQVALPYAVGNFALGRIESPIIHKVLSRHPYIKITSAYRDNAPTSHSFSHLADFYFADVDQKERHAMGASLSNLIRTHMSRFEIRPMNSEQTTFPITRTPELGVVKGDQATIAPIQAGAEKRLESAESEGTKTEAQLETKEVMPAQQGGRNVQSIHQAQNAAWFPENQKQAAGAEWAPQRSTAPSRATDTNAPRRSRPNPAVTTPSSVTSATDRHDQVDRIVKKVKKASKHKDVEALVKFVAVSAFLAAFLWAVVTIIGPHWEKSGSTYSEQLKIFAPQNRFGRELEKARGGKRD